MLGFNPLSAAPISSLISSAISLLGFTIAQNESLSAALAVSRPVSLSVAEAQSVATTLAVKRALLASIAETESVLAAVTRSAAMALNMGESATVTADIARKTAITATIAAAEGVSSDLTVKRANSLFISASASLAAQLDRLARLVASIGATEQFQFINSSIVKLAAQIDETQSLAAALVLERGISAAIAQAEAVDPLGLTALRNSSFNLSQTSDIVSLLGVIRELVQTIASTEELTFTITVGLGLNQTLNVAITWNEWQSVGNVQKLVAMSDSMQFTTLGAADAVVSFEDTTIVVVP